MSVPYKNPISSVQVSTPQSVSRTSVFGTNFSILNVGGYVEVNSLSDLSLTLTASTYPSLIQLSANTIPIRFTKGNGTFLSPDFITLNSDNISSGRRRLGMMVYVHETDLVYQYVIPNYDTLWNNLSGLTGFSAVTYSDYTTVVNNRSSEGQSFIEAWTASTIEGVSGYTSTNANWRIFQPGGGGIFTGGTVTGPTIFTNGLTANTISATTYYNLPPDIYVTGGTYSSGTATFTNNTGGTFSVTGFSTSSGGTFTGGTVSGATNFTNGLTANTISAQTIYNQGIDIISSLYDIESTGADIFTGLTKVSTTQFNVAPVHGYIVDNTGTNKIITEVNYSGISNQTTPYINTDVATYVLINSSSSLVLQPTYPTPTQRRQNIFLGRIAHPNKTSIVTANNTTDFIYSPMSALRDMFTAIQLVNSGIVISPNGSNLSFNNSAGTLYGMGINFYSNKTTPDSVSISGGTPVTFQYRTQTGGTYSDTTTLEVNYYDLNGVRTAISGTKSTNQRVYLFPSGQVRVQYGQTTYSTLSNAISSVLTEPFVTFSNNRDNAILIGVISVQSNATDLTNTNQAYFSSVSKFGELLGGTGGISTTTLQQAYDNSSTPEIVINSTLDGLSIKNGTGNADNVTNLLEGINSGGTLTSFIRADGLFSGNSVSTPGFTANTNGLTATTISATTYQNLPTDIRVTGGTYSSGTLTFTNNTGGTFSVTGITTSSAFTGGTVTGATNFTGGLTANTISATTITSPSISSYGLIVATSYGYQNIF